MNDRYTEICRVCNGPGRTLSSKGARELRLKRELTLKIVASKMGISMGYLCDLENGRKSWNSDLQARFTKAIR